MYQTYLNYLTQHSNPACLPHAWDMDSNQPTAELLTVLDLYIGSLGKDQISLLKFYHFYTIAEWKDQNKIMACQGYQYSLEAQHTKQIIVTLIQGDRPILHDVGL